MGRGKLAGGQIAIYGSDKPVDADDVMSEVAKTGFFERVAEYSRQVDAEAEEGLCAEDLAVLRMWRDGGALDWDAVYKNNRPAYRAIMFTISRGCG